MFSRNSIHPLPLDGAFPGFSGTSLIVKKKTKT